MALLPRRDFERPQNPYNSLSVWVLDFIKRCDELGMDMGFNPQEHSVVSGVRVAKNLWVWHLDARLLKTGPWSAGVLQQHLLSQGGALTYVVTKACCMTQPLCTCKGKVVGYLLQHEVM